MLCAIKKSLLVGFLSLASAAVASPQIAQNSNGLNQGEQIKPGAAELLKLGTAFEGQLKKSLVQSMGLNEELFQISVSGLSTTPSFLDLDYELELVEIFGVGTQGASRVDGLISIPANIKINNERIEEVILSAAVKVTGPVWVAAENLHRGEVINRQKLRLTQLPWSRVPTHVLMTRAEDLEGRSIKYAVQQGAFVSKENLGKKNIIKNGDAVSLTIQSGPGVFIRSRAIAKQGGKLGDVIRVEQPQTRKTVRAVVVGAKKVEVQL